jgi:uncharacterized protein YoxC
MNETEHNLHERIDELKERVKKLENHVAPGVTVGLDALTCRANQLEKERNKLKRQLDDIKKEIEYFERQLVDMTAERDEANQLLYRLSTDLGKATVERDKLKKQLYALRQQLTGAEAMLDENRLANHAHKKRVYIVRPIVRGAWRKEEWSVQLEQCGPPTYLQAIDHDFSNPKKLTMRDARFSSKDLARQYAVGMGYEVIPDEDEEIES